MFNFDEQFFEKRQKRLIKIANSFYLRWILGLNRLPKNIKSKRFDKITPNSIHSDGVGYFFSRPRFAEAIAYNTSPLLYIKELKEPKIKWQFSPVGLAYILLFGLMGTFAGLPFVFVGTTTNYYPISAYPMHDDSIEVTNADWATARGASTGTLKSNTSPYIKANKYVTYNITRYFANIVTSGLTSSATISAASLNLYGASKSGTLRGYNVVSSTCTDPVDAGDFDLRGATVYSDSDIIQADIVTNAYNTWNFNATGISGINKTGTSKFAVLETLKDLANSAPTDEAFFQIESSYQTGTSKDPYLAVTYTLPASGPANLKSLNTNLTANIKSYNTNLIANVKSINTNV